MRCILALIGNIFNARNSKYASMDSYLIPADADAASGTIVRQASTGESDDRLWSEAKVAAARLSLFYNYIKFKLRL